MSEWKYVGSELEGVVYLTRINDGMGIRNVQKLRRRGNLWFYPDGSGYVYYTPNQYKEI